MAPSSNLPQLNRDCLKHKGPAVVSVTIIDLAARIDNEDLQVDENSVLVLQNAGSTRRSWNAGVGNVSLVPKKLLQRGVRDMVRFSDARMSGTASWSMCVLHVAPESFVGGPLHLFTTVILSIWTSPARKLELVVDDEELSRRRAAWKPAPPRYERGFGALYAAHVTQADKGCDFDVLEAGAETPEPEIH
jgi:dihydroxy-acid dehydratase